MPLKSAWCRHAAYAGSHNEAGENPPPSAAGAAQFQTTVQGLYMPADVEAKHAATCFIKKMRGEM